MAVLILGNQVDEHARHVFSYLKDRGVDVELLDSRSFPQQCTLAFDPSDKTGLLRCTSGRALPWHEIRSVYWRTYEGVEGPDLPDAEQARIAANDARGLFETFLIQSGARWVNSWRAWQLHQTKPVQLARVAELGIAIPATLISNDADQVLRFAARHRQCIFKPVQGGAHTRRLTSAHLTEENLANLACAPITLQEEVPGTNVRVFLAGTKVLACEINTPEIDFRDDAQPEIRPIAITEQLANSCLSIARRLELVWTGIDWRRTPQGLHVFLEANPSPMFMGFEAQTGLPLTQSLASLLTA